MRDNIKNEHFLFLKVSPPLHSLSNIPESDLRLAFALPPKFEAKVFNYDSASGNLFIYFSITEDMED